jgi:hypothetical protein
VADLSAQLGNNFVLLLGSALSGVASPKLAMVDVVRDTTVSLMSTQIRPHTYLNSLYREYARLLSTKGGPYKNLLDNTKFESFLRMVSDASSRDAVNDLLDQLYTCKADEPGPNHKAVAALLKSGKSLTCLTTNFDNAIELGCKEASVSYQLRDDPGDYPWKLPEVGEEPLIIKLHGSAPKRNCVFDSSGLLSAQSRETQKHLQDLLTGRRVLVFGYSGLGDIDISPHLSQIKATFFWADRQYPEQDRLPPWASYFVLSDLKVPREGQAPNLLLEMAGVTIRPGDVSEKHEDAHSIIERWARHTRLDAKKLVISLFAWRRTLPVLHLRHEELADGDRTSNSLKYGMGCAQARVYSTGYEILRSELTDQTLNKEDRYRANQARGFALWRMAKWKEARELLEQLITDWHLDFPFDNPGISDLQSDIYRTYLEVCRDILQTLPANMRHGAASMWRVKEALSTLYNIEYESPENLILAHFVGDNLDWLLGKDVAVSKIEELYERCVNFEVYNSAAVVLGLLLQMSFLKSWRRFCGLNRKFRSEGVTHYIAKNYELLIFAVLARLFLPFGIVGHLALRTLFHAAYGFKTIVGENQHRK